MRANFIQPYLFMHTETSAPLWRRFLSMLYDSFLLGALTMAYGALITLVLYFLQGDTTGGEYRPMISGTAGNAAFLFGLWLTYACFYVFFWTRAGQTAGMRAWRLRVARCEAVEHHPTLQQSALRILLAPLSLLLMGVGYWWRWFDADGDCFHDRYSGTRVLVTPPRKRRKATGSV